MVWIIDNLVEVLSLFAQVAGYDPVSPLLLLGSVGILTVALGVFGVLAVGGVLSALAGN
ncbi:MAG: hypothetical protein ABEJ44_07265 [Halanaeroarchaeum sp.]